MKIKEKVLAALVMILVMVAPFTSFADDLPSVPGMIKDLYANEKDNVKRSMEIDYALVLTGYKKPEKVYNGAYTIVATYPTAPTYELAIDLSLLGTQHVRIGTINGDYSRTAIMIVSDEPLTEEAFAANIQDLTKIYALVQEVKETTMEMDDLTTLLYIEKYIESLVPVYVAGCDPIAAVSINNGYCDCDGYAELTYIFGINCGLDISNVSGYVYNDPSLGHAWNEIVIDGVTYVHDTTWDFTACTDKYLAALPESLASDGRRCREYISACAAPESDLTAH